MVFLVAYAVPILDPQARHEVRWLCHKAVLVTWVFFAFDYVFRLVLAREKWTFVRKHVFDLVVVALPMLRPLRILRLVTLLTVLNRYAARSMRGRVGVFVGSAVCIVVFTASLAELNAERRAHGANITTFGDALWWAVSTISTVGYGDRYPVTTTGRLIAVGLMVAGIALLGVVTAAVAAWLIREVQDIEEEEEAATRRDVRELRKEIRELRKEIRKITQP